MPGRPPQRAVAAYHELLRRGKDAVGAIRAGLHHENPAVREGCCRLLDHLVDTDSMSQLIAMTGDPDARVRIAAFHALACDRYKGDTFAPGADEVLDPALRHLASDPDAHVRTRAAELAGKFVHTDGRAVTALERARAQDPSPVARMAAICPAKALLAHGSSPGSPGLRLVHRPGARRPGYAGPLKPTARPRRAGRSAAGKSSQPV